MTITDTPSPDEREFAISVTLIMANLLKSYDGIGLISTSDKRITLHSSNNTELFAQTKSILQKHDKRPENEDLITLDFSGSGNSCREIVESFSQAVLQKLEAEGNQLQFSSQPEKAALRLAMMARGHMDADVNINQSSNTPLRFTLRNASAVSAQEIADFFPGAKLYHNQHDSHTLEIPYRGSDIENLRSTFGKLALSAIHDINALMVPPGTDMNSSGYSQSQPDGPHRGTP